MDKQYDIIVVGGGFTGVAAAVSASREGCSVLLIEQSGYLGGAATNCLVNPFMKYYTTKINEEGKDEKYFINRGIFDIILARLREMGGMSKNNRTFNEEYIKLIFDRLCKENNVKVLFHTMLIDTVVEGMSVKEVVVANKSGIQKFSANYFIDCTGDADLSAMAGCEFQVGREEDSLCQPMTLCFRLANVDRKKFNENKSKITPLYKEFQKQGKIKNPREDVLIFDHMSDGVLHFNTTRIVKKNPLDAFDLSYAEAEAREQIYEMYNFLKNNIEGFENATLIMSAPNIGVRESRMINGDYKITADDILGCKKFNDSIACGAYEVDIHNPDGTGTLIKFLPKGEHYTIPYRALTPKGKDNLLVAGRCISSTHEAQSSYRVLPIVCCIGEGAGIAISVANKNNTDIRNIDINEVHKIMDKYNAMY